MSSSGDLSTQTKSNEFLIVENIIANLSNLLDRLSQVKQSIPHNSTGSNIHNEFEKLQRDLKTMISSRNQIHQIIASFQKLKKFEDDAGGPIKNLECSLNEISNVVAQASNDFPVTQVQTQLSALKKDVMKLKFNFPSLPLKMSTKDSVVRSWSRNGSNSVVNELPSLHMNHKFICSSVFTEFQDVFKDLDIRLKLCLLSFAVLPANAVVKRRLLINWWVGERLVDVDPPATGEKTAEDIVKEILTELKLKGFIEPVKESHKLVADRFKMQPLVHRVVIMLAQEAQLLGYDSNGNPTVNSSWCNRACLVKAKEGTSEQVLMKFQTSEELSKYFDDLGNLQTIFNVNEPFPDLRFEWSAKISKVNIMEWFSKMKNLNVLYLGMWQISDQHHIEVESSDQHRNVRRISLKNQIEVKSTEFLKGLKNMKCLRLLSLQGISRISELPNSIGKLTNLRILDLKACHNLEALPDGIASLKKLSRLDISGCYLIDDMPKGLASLLELQVLKGFVVGNLESDRDSNHRALPQPFLGGLCFRQNRDLCTLEDLKGLKKLSKLSIYTRSKGFPTGEELKALRKLEALRKLAIAWGVNSKKKENGVLSSAGAVSSDNGMQDSGAAQPTRAPSRVLNSAGAESSDSEGQNSGAAQPTRAPSRVLSSAGAESSDSKRQHSGAAQPTRAPSRVLSSAGAESSDSERQHSGGAQPTRAPSRVLSSAGAKSSDSEGQNSGAAQPTRAPSRVLSSAGAESSDSEGQNSGAAQPTRAPSRVLSSAGAESSDSERQNGGAAQPTRAPSRHNSKQPHPETLGLPINLEKLELQSFPDDSVTLRHNWLMPEKLTSLKKLYIRGGKLNNLRQMQEGSEKWKVEILRLKYLNEFYMDWDELQMSFPKLIFLEKVKCKLTSFLCDRDQCGVWLKQCGVWLKH